MKILITSGGTINRIDQVRSIRNFSSGRFGCALAEEALKKKDEVWYFHAKHAKLPFSDQFIVDRNKSLPSQFKRIQSAQEDFSKIKDNLHLVQFETFEEYAKGLQKLVRENNYDIAILAAAVSDYALEPRDGKISSENDDLVLKLYKTPKLVGQIKKWSKKPLFQVGFKLLVNSSESELADTAYRALLTHHSDLVLANDLTRIKPVHQVLLVTPEKGVLRINKVSVAKEVVDFIRRRAGQKHYRSQVEVDKNLNKKFVKEFEDFKKAIKGLSGKNAFTPFSQDDPRSHGSLSLRVPGGFLITARGSNKSEFNDEDIVLVRNVDLKSGLIKCISTTGNKPSFNAGLSFLTFKQFPRINALVHTHQLIANAPTTSFAHTPGTVEYAESPLELLKKSPFINLKDHGCLAMGESIEEATNYVFNN